MIRGMRPSSQPNCNYIVKDDFIVNLRKGRKNSLPRPKLQLISQPSYIQRFSQMVRKKKQIFDKLSCSCNNDFYELDKQIQNNQKKLYRKLRVQFRKQNSEIQSKLKNPFSQHIRPEYQKEKQLGKNKNLSYLIYKVQPHWIKKHLSKVYSQRQSSSFPHK